MISLSVDWRPRMFGYRGFTFSNAIFDKAILFSLNWKVAKAELYLKGYYHNEWLELTYFIETLIPIRMNERTELIKELLEFPRPHTKSFKVKKTNVLENDILNTTNTELDLYWKNSTFPCSFVF